MKKFIITNLLLVLSICLMAEKEVPIEYVIYSVSFDSIKIGDTYRHPGDTFRSNEKIDWLDESQKLCVYRSDKPSMGKQIFAPVMLWKRRVNDIYRYFFGIQSKGGRSLGGGDELLYADSPLSRIALVIGNSNYLYRRGLTNPANDAISITESLRKKGFDVILCFDRTKEEIYDDVDYFCKLSRNESYKVSLFFFIGHGGQSDQKDYIVPIDARGGSVDSCCVDVNDVISKLTSAGHKKGGQTLVFINACRESLNDVDSISSYIMRDTEPATGSAILYATQPGVVAEEGKLGELSPFAQSFISAIDVPGQSYSSVANMIVSSVASTTRGCQTPARFGSSDFVFYPYDSSDLYNSSDLETEVSLFTLEAEYKEKHQFVDLGLPSKLKWATMNIGAENISSSGVRFAWGETKRSFKYGFETYDLCAGDEKKLTKYCSSLKFSYYNHYDSLDHKIILDPEDDVAHVWWGGNWRMPTEQEIHELVYQCTWKLVEVNHQYGYQVIGPNGNSIFLPFDDRQKEACYWSSSLFEDYPSCARSLKIGKVEERVGIFGKTKHWDKFIDKRIDFPGQEGSLATYWRYECFFIRPVCP